MDDGYPLLQTFATDGAACGVDIFTHRVSTSVRLSKVAELSADPLQRVCVHSRPKWRINVVGSNERDLLPLPATENRKLWMTFFRTLIGISKIDDFTHLQRDEIFRMSKSTSS